MVESKFYKKKEPHTNNNLKKHIRSFITKVLLTIIVTLILLIGFKTNLDFKSNFNKYVYNTSLPFTDFKALYDKYFLGTKNNDNDTKEVFNENLVYTDKSMYEDGVKLTVKSWLPFFTSIFLFKSSTILSSIISSSFLSIIS